MSFRYLRRNASITIQEFAKHKLSESENIPFIDLIICLNYFAAYKSNSLEYFGLEKEKYKHGGQYYPTTNGSDTDPRAVFDEVSYDVEEIFKGIRIKTLSKQKPYVDIDFTKEGFDRHILITTKFWNTFGRCYSIIPRDDVLKLGVNSIIFETTIDIYVYFGHPGQFLAANRNSKVTQF